MQLLKFTLILGDDIWINPEHIVSISPVANPVGNGTHAHITFDYPDGTLDVRQSPEQILSLLSGGTATA
jgi:hypothetical protein